MRRQRAVSAWATIGIGVLLLALTGCSGAAAKAGDAGKASASDPAVTLPPTTGAADYQLGGDYTPPKGVTVVTRDSTGRPAPGIYSICYVNGFQTQPDVTWPSDLVLNGKNGKPLVDPGWPDEHIIDISTADKRVKAASMQNKSIELCAKKGFKAVEFDNLDSYSRSKGAATPLTKQDAIDFATLLVADAHAAGLAAGQKNTGQLGSKGKTEIGYDFAVSEECDTYDECGSFTKVYGAHVIDIEYTDDQRGTFAQICARKATAPMTMLRDRDLTTPKSKAYVYAHC